MSLTGLTKWRPSYPWFKLSIAAGVLLSLLLLGQSIVTYQYVSRNLVVNLLRREADRQAVFLERYAREQSVRDPAELAEVLKDAHENEARIAWMRVIDARGQTLVSSGAHGDLKYEEERIRQLLLERRPVFQFRDSPEGDVMVTLTPLRIGMRRGRPPGEAGPPPGQPKGDETKDGQFKGPRGGGPMGARLLEVALYMNSRTGAYWPLRRNLIVGCSAAAALLFAMVFMAFRFRHYVRGKQLEQQLELARQVQRDLLPSGAPPLEGLECAAECVPAWQVGGDFYDVFTTPDNGLAFVLGDVSGKGLPAALLMGLLHGAIRSSSWVTGPAELEASSTRLNELLCTRTSRERFASLVWCFLNRETGELRYVNAGHLPPLLVTPNGGEPEIRELEAGGPVLGLLPAAQYHHGTTQCQPGDLLVLYSDGVVEASDASDREFGMERFAAILRKSFRRPPAEVVKEVLAQVDAFLGDAQPQDDLTLLVVRVPG